MFIRAALLAGMATVGIVGDHARAGTDADPESSDAPPGDVSTADATAGETVGTVVVTARRRAESVQSAPLAVSVITGEQIDNTGAFNVGRLQQLTPTLNFYSSNPRNTAINIRGIGVPFGLTNDGFDQGVGIYVDDVYYARIAASTLDFLDVAQIEVLRGPQGTLYGKNTTAGAINITTHAPTFDVSGRAEVTLGNLDFRQAKASISGPLADSLAARLAVSSTSRRGTIYNVTSGSWINEQDNLGVRGQLLWRPTDGVEITLAADYNEQDPECCAQIYARTGPTQRAPNRQFDALAAAQGYAVPSTNPFERVTDVDAELNAGNEIGGASVRVRWDLGPGVLTSITAWRYWDWLPANDRDFLGLPITTLSQNPSQQDQYTQEIRYTVSGPRFDLLAGAFAFEQKVRTQGSQQQGPAASRWLINPANALANDPSVLAGLTAANDIRLDNTSAALFGQLTWRIGPSLRVQPGIRLNYDRKTGLYERMVTDGEGSPVLFGQPGAARAAQLAVLAPQRFEPQFSDWNVSGDLTASYAAAPDTLAYATYARAYKSGGINLNGVPNDSTGTPILAVASVRPESVDHYELGLKHEFWNGAGTLNVAAFRTDIDDYQALVVNGQTGVLRGFLANADRVRTQGVEVDLSVRPTAGLRTYLNAAWTDATYRRFPDAPCPPELSGGGTGASIAAPGVPGNSPPNCDISGQRLPGVSDWSVSYGVEANAAVSLFGTAGEAYAAVDGNYRSRFSSNPTPSAYTWVDGYALTNLRVGFRSAAGFDFFAWARNAFDTEYFEQLAVPSGNTGLIVGQPGDPRTYGLTLSVRF